jgi:eukaryotic-like serine/threonine-protein kinase
MSHAARKVIARHMETPVSGSQDTAPSTGRIPEELLFEQVQRLAVFSLVAFAVWTFALLLDLFVLPAASPTGTRNWRSVAIQVAASIAAMAMYGYLRWSQRAAATAPASAAGRDPWLEGTGDDTAAPARASVQAQLNAGLLFMLANAVGIALFNVWASPPGAHDFPHLSWITILILTYSIIAPTSPRRMLVACLVAASMDPLAFLLGHLSGLPVPSALQVGILAWPNYACAAIAMLPSHVLQRIGRRLHEAQKLGSYALVERLGEGGMGEVWRAEHRLLARHAAVKLVRPEVLGVHDEKEATIALRRFEREAQATAALRSPHTIQIFDFGVTDQGTFYYVMELLTGRDLESLVREFGPVPANRVVHLLRQVCHSLAEAHERGLVHRDIKPANVYVCRMGLEYDFVKVLDFGLVKMHERGRAETLMTLDQRTTGTPAYMAPETILGDSDVDRRADVYALGCVAYYLLTGQLVFEADTSMKVLMQHVHAQPVPPSQRSELPIPRELDDLVLACLQKDPDRRPQNAWELFQMACGCRTCDGWTQDHAKSWWTTHLPELTRPLPIGAGRAPATEGTIRV